MQLSRKPEIDRFLANPPETIRAAVIFGQDRGMVQEIATLLATRLVDHPDDPFNVALLTDGDLETAPDRLESELMALSMLGARRLVRLRLSSERAAPERLAAEGLEAHARGDLNPQTFFLIECLALDKTSPLRRAAEKAAAVVTIPCYEDEPEHVAKLIREALANDQIQLEADALNALVLRLPKDRGLVRREIERLALFIGPGRGQRVDLALLSDFLGLDAAGSLAEAAVDAFGGRVKAAVIGLRKAAQQGETGPAVIRALSGQAARLRRIQTFKSLGKTAVEAAKATRIFWKLEREMIRQAGAWSFEQLDEMSNWLAEGERLCKSTAAPDILLSERLAFDIALRARDLGL